MTVGLSAPDAALVHGFTWSEEDGGEADNTETDRQKQSHRYSSAALDPKLNKVNAQISLSLCVTNQLNLKCGV